MDKHKVKSWIHRGWPVFLILLLLSMIGKGYCEAWGNAEDILHVADSLGHLDDLRDTQAVAKVLGIEIAPAQWSDIKDETSSKIDVIGQRLILFAKNLKLKSLFSYTQNKFLAGKEPWGPPLIVIIMLSLPEQSQCINRQTIRRIIRGKVMPAPDIGDSGTNWFYAHTSNTVRLEIIRGQTRHDMDCLDTIAVEEFSR